MSWIISGGSHCGQIKSPKSFHLTEFTEHALRSFQNTITECLNSSQGVLPIFIESRGGSVDVMAGMLSLMEGGKRDGMKFSTVVNGLAASAAAMIWSFGDNDIRFIGDNGKLMFHQAHGFQGGKLSEMRNTLDTYIIGEEALFEKISKNLKKPKGWLAAGIKKRQNADWYLTADDVVKENLGVKHTPKFLFSIQESFSIV